MLRTYKSELIRFRRTAIFGMAIMAGLTTLVTLLTFFGFENSARPGAGRGPIAGSGDLASIDGPVAGLSFAATAIGIVALALCAMSVARDFERGTIRQILVFEPRRPLVLGGKLVALLTIIGVGVGVSAFAGIGSAFAAAPIKGVSTDLWTTVDAASNALSTTLNVAIATAIWGFTGAVLGMIYRSASAAITTGVGYLLVGEPLLNLVWDTAPHWLVSGTLNTFTNGGTESVSYSQSAMLVTLYAALFVLATFVVFARRDITD